MARLRLLLATKDDFRFWPTVQSHGWSSLPPFTADPAKRSLSRVLSLPGGLVLECTLDEVSGGVRVTCESPSPLSHEQRRALRTRLSASLRLDEDLSVFHKAIRKDPGYRWISGVRAGRLLRCPTVFEDLIKIICTTNCSWALTTLMTKNLVECLGPSTRTGSFGFPDPAAIAGCTEQFFRRNIRSGYRSPYLIELAESVASGRIAPERWRLPGQQADQIRTELLTIKGVGHYAAENILRLLGHYEYTGLDSWVRSRYYSIYHRGRRVSDRTINARYKRFGRWGGLVLWLEMTRSWYEEKGPELTVKKSDG